MAHCGPLLLAAVSPAVLPGPLPSPRGQTTLRNNKVYQNGRWRGRPYCRVRQYDEPTRGRYVADLFGKLRRGKVGQQPTSRRGTRQRRGPIRYYFTSRQIAATEEPSAQFSGSLPSQKAQHSTMIKAAVSSLRRLVCGQSLADDRNQGIEPANNKRDCADGREDCQISPGDLPPATFEANHVIPHLTP